MRQKTRGNGAMLCKKNLCRRTLAAQGEIAEIEKY